LAERKSNSFQSQNRTDSMIGASMRIAGNVTFTGVLRIQGDIVGDIACDNDPHGTIVTDSSGKISGSIKSPRIVVKGNLSGPAHVAESIQVQQDGRIVGDIFYKEIEIHKGGVIEGHLTSDFPHGSEQYLRAGHPEEPSGTGTPATESGTGTPATKSGTSTPESKSGTSTPESKSGTSLRYVLGGTALFVVIGLMLSWVNPLSTEEKLAMNGSALKADSSTNNASAAPSTPTGNAPQQIDPQKETGRESQIVATGADTLAATAADQLTSSKNSDGDLGKITVVQGVNPGKPDDFFWITAKEPTVLLKKKREDKTDGTRIDVPSGKKITIAIAKDEILRVIQGRNIEILFQGKKVGSKTIEGGAWMSFKPHAEHR